MDCPNGIAGWVDQNRSGITENTNSQSVTGGVDFVAGFGFEATDSIGASAISTGDQSESQSTACQTGTASAKDSQVTFEKSIAFSNELSQTQ
ncbi:MAG: hypothetical protein ACI9XU_001446 [Arenicella sp.]|jgi:hypothetical protein